MTASGQTPGKGGDGEASPSGKWKQRALSFVAGVAASFVSHKVAHWIPGATGVTELGISAAIGVWFLFRGPHWRWFSYVAGVAFVWVALLAFLFMPSSVENWVRSRSFDADAWKSAELGRGETRVWMADDLLAHHSPIGRPVAEIDVLLGKDDSVRGTGWGRGYWDGWDRVWWLGPERGFIRIDSEWLVLRHDAAGVVTEAKLVRD